ncbi:MAG: TIGR03936 family radical SAM-associated protein [Phycisphaerales bacterium]
MAGRYKVQGNVRFLSHQEAFRAVGRALIRSGLNLVYSQGYNPHLKMSLPLPKSVGLESEDELFYVQVADEQFSEKEIYKNLTAQLPEGFTLTELAIHNGRVSFKPTEVEYLVGMSDEEIKNVSAVIDNLNAQLTAGEKILIDRIVDEEGNIKIVDVAQFLKSFEKTHEGVKVVCLITDRGTVRPDEIIKLLGLRPERLGISMIRKRVAWSV